jgi:hypothetical protein
MVKVKLSEVFGQNIHLSKSGLRSEDEFDIKLKSRRGIFSMLEKWFVSGNKI